MEKIVFTCKTVTPLVMNGAYGEFPELRPPGIKASLRFWWRALHGDLVLDKMRDKEAVIFGSTGGRSNVIIRIEQNIKDSFNPKTFLLPHKENDGHRSPVPAFTPDLQFKLRLDFNKKIITKDKLQSLFVLACTLGGWGKRSRRGFGAVTVTEIDGIPFSSPLDLNAINKCLNCVNPNKFIISANKITPTTPISKERREEFPYIIEIELGEKVQSTFGIGEATHIVMSENEPQKLNYKYVLGSGSPRFASPLVVSILENGHPVITTLKLFGPSISRNDSERGTSLTPYLQSNLKSEIFKK